MGEDERKTWREPLRPSLFSGVPPFINYVPAFGLHFGGHSLECGPQYWDEDEVKERQGMLTEWEGSVQLTSSLR
jgi:hypothetical protein